MKATSRPRNLDPEKTPYRTNDLPCQKTAHSLEGCEQTAASSNSRLLKKENTRHRLSRAACSEGMAA